MALSPQWLDELRSRTLLSALIGRTVKITRAGREWKACCPFHNEKTPSFTINDEKGFYHCLAGETVVITAKGRFPISTLSGQVHSVLTRGGCWIDARFSDYGKQQLWRLSLSRNGVKKEIFATSEHRWFVHDRVSEFLTTDLKPGHALQSAIPAARQNWELDPEGVRHGIMFGDGSMYKGVYGTLNLHGEKDVQLRKWFPAQAHHVHDRDNGALYLRIYGGRAFANMKDLPKTGASESYLLGFLAGYLAADGHVAKDGTVMLNSANAEHLEAVRDICTMLGIATYGRTTLMRTGYGKTPSALHRIHFVNATLAEAIFLLNGARQRFRNSAKKFARLRWVVRSVELTDRVETVYCAEVPSEHAFALDDNILTGNCFGCSAHGDAIRWMTDQRGLPFMDAVKELAAAAGMDVPAPDPQSAQRQEEQKSLRDVTEAAATWFADQLAAPTGEAARAYLKQRGLSDDIRRAFGLGLAPDSRNALRTALNTFPLPMLIESGMLIQPPEDAPMDRQEPYDRFRGRLMIPIRDARGRTIAFGGRILGSGEPKYLNSPDTPLFDKGRILYNLNRAAPAARATNRLIVVEGYMDVIALAQAGIAEAVAPLGTALTEEQLILCWRQIPVPILAFDGDAAGQRAAMRAALRALPMLKAGYSLSILTLPPGKDPDDVVRAQGAEGFDALARDAQPLSAFLWQQALATQRDETPEGRASVKAQLMAWVDTITDRDVAALYRRDFLERFGARFFPPREARPASQNSSGRRPFQSRNPQTADQPVDVALTQSLLAGLLRWPDLIASRIDLLCQLPLADRRDAQLLDAIIDAASFNTGLDQTALLTILAGSDGYNRAVELLRTDRVHLSFTRRVAGNADEPATLPATAMAQFDELLGALAAWPEVERSLAAAEARTRESLDEASWAEQQRWRAEHEALRDRLKNFAEQASA